MSELIIRLIVTGMSGVKVFLSRAVASHRLGHSIIAVVTAHTAPAATNTQRRKSIDYRM